eukprot:356269-Chlamydomonas_euryale.AAC.5
MGVIFNGCRFFAFFKLIQAKDATLNGSRGTKSVVCRCSCSCSLRLGLPALFAASPPKCSTSFLVGVQGSAMMLFAMSSTFHPSWSLLSAPTHP